MCGRIHVGMEDRPLEDDPGTVTVRIIVRYQHLEPENTIYLKFKFQYS